MALPIFLLILLIPLAVLVVIVLLILAAFRPEVTGLDRRQLGVRWAGIGIGLLAVLALVAAEGLPGRLGHGALWGAAPLVGASTLIATVLLGETGLRRTLETTRRASLRPHGPLDVLPGLTTIITVAIVLALAALMVTTSLLASADDMGRPGRALSASGTGAAGLEVTAVSSPYPGSWTTLPAGIALALLCLLAALALHTIVTRRSAEDLGDLLVRRRSAAAVLGAVLLGAGSLMVVLSGLAFLMADSVTKSLAASGAEAPSSWTGIAVLEAVVALVGALAVPYGLVLVLAPSLLAVRDRGRDNARPVVAAEAEGR